MRVGILTSRVDGAAPFNRQTSLFKRMLKTGSELGVTVYVFDSRDVNWVAKKVYGYTFTAGRWVRRQYPLPDVVYDRTFGLNFASTDMARRRLTSSFGVKLFNTHLGGKMRMYNLMRADALLCAHLPATHRVCGAPSVAKALAVNGSAYLKPETGAQGKGLINLRRSANGVSYTFVAPGYKNIGEQAAGVAAALSILRSHVNLSSYLVQPDIRLLRTHGGICDVRALVQRGGDGAWSLTGAAVRVGRPGQIISNLHGGGRALRLDTLLGAAFSDAATVATITQRIEELALRVGDVLARSTRCLGELGVDLGVDKTGKIWIIEANSRTGRSIFRRVGMDIAAHEADTQPFRFAMYLCGHNA